MKASDQDEFFGSGDASSLQGLALPISDFS